MAAMTTSAEGVALILQSEGFRANLYNDDAGHCTIGYGHLVHRGKCDGSESEEFRKGISRARARDLFSDKLVGFEASVNRLVTVPITQSQFDALVSFTYNLGAGALQSSKLLQKLNAGDADGAANEFAKWNKAGGKVLGGLVTRRAAEADLFRRKNTPPPPTPTPVPLPAPTPSPPNHPAGGGAASFSESIANKFPAPVAGITPNPGTKATAETGPPPSETAATRFSHAVHQRITSAQRWIKARRAWTKENQVVFEAWRQKRDASYTEWRGQRPLLLRKWEKETIKAYYAARKKGSAAYNTFYERRPTELKAWAGRQNALLRLLLDRFGDDLMHRNALREQAYRKFSPGSSGAATYPAALYVHWGQQKQELLQQWLDNARFQFALWNKASSYARTANPGPIFDAQTNDTEESHGAKQGTARGIYWLAKKLGFPQKFVDSLHGKVDKLLKAVKVLNYFGRFYGILRFPTLIAILQTSGDLLSRAGKFLKGVPFLAALQAIQSITSAARLGKSQRTYDKSIVDAALAENPDLAAFKEESARFRYENADGEEANFVEAMERLQQYPFLNRLSTDTFNPQHFKKAAAFAPWARWLNAAGDVFFAGSTIAVLGIATAPAAPWLAAASILSKGLASILNPASVIPDWKKTKRKIHDFATGRSTAGKILNPVGAVMAAGRGAWRLWEGISDEEVKAQEIFEKDFERLETSIGREYDIFRSAQDDKYMAFFKRVVRGVHHTSKQMGISPDINAPVTGAFWRQWYANRTQTLHHLFGSDEQKTAGWVSGMEQDATAWHDRGEKRMAGLYPDGKKSIDARERFNLWFTETFTPVKTLYHSRIPFPPNRRQRWERLMNYLPHHPGIAAFPSSTWEIVARMGGSQGTPAREVDRPPHVPVPPPTPKPTLHHIKTPAYRIPPHPAFLPPTPVAAPAPAPTPTAGGSRSRIQRSSVSRIEKDADLSSRLNPARLRASLVGTEGAGFAPTAGVRELLAPIVGFDPAHARLHRGASSVRAARALNADAFTIGQDVFFGANQYDYNSPRGLGLLAHELTHVGQQTGSGSGESSPRTQTFSTHGNSGGDAMEQQAQRIGKMVASGGFALPRSLDVETYTVNYEVQNDELSSDDRARLAQLSEEALAAAKFRLAFMGLPSANVDRVVAAVAIDLAAMTDAEITHVWADAIVSAIKASVPARKTAVSGVRVQRQVATPPIAENAPSPAQNRTTRTPAEVREVAESITGAFESGNNPSRVQNHDAGIISYGRHQATLASGKLQSVIRRFVERAAAPNASPAAQAARQQLTAKTLQDDAGNWLSYQEWMESYQEWEDSSKLKPKNLRAAAASENKRRHRPAGPLGRILEEAGRTPEMQAAQADEFNIEWTAAQQRTTAHQLRSPLAQALLYDMAINTGAEGNKIILKRTVAAVGKRPVNNNQTPERQQQEQNLYEQRFLHELLNQRRKYVMPKKNAHTNNDEDKRVIAYGRAKSPEQLAALRTEYHQRGEHETQKQTEENLLNSQIAELQTALSTKRGEQRRLKSVRPRQRSEAQTERLRVLQTEIAEATEGIADLKTQRTSVSEDIAADREFLAEHRQDIRGGRIANLEELVEQGDLELAGDEQGLIDLNGTKIQGLPAPAPAAPPPPN